jgi:hypothetical protein
MGLIEKYESGDSGGGGDPPFGVAGIATSMGRLPYIYGLYITYCECTIQHVS